MSNQLLDAYRLILIWPLSLVPSDGKSKTAKEALQQTLQDIREDAESWEPVANRLADVDHGPAADTNKTRMYRFGEHVYFHHFVQSFLYRGDSKAPAVHVFRRKGVERLRVGLTRFDGTRVEPVGTVHLEVVRINLYLFDAGSAALVAELSAGDDSFEAAESGGVAGPLPLRHAMTLSDKLRRSFPPYFLFPKEADQAKGGGKPPQPAKTWSYPGLFEEDVEWLDGSDRESIRRANKWADVAHEIADGKRVHTPVSNDWRMLVSPLRLEGYPASDGDDTPQWRHLVDDRMPTMQFVKVASPEAIGEGDFMRFCFCDGAGNDPYPYAEDFLRKDWSLYTYDRFWGGGYSTRFLCSGFNFAIVCKSGDFFSEHLEQHFRRHYFRIGLILQFQYAALLSYSGRISRAVENHLDDKTDFRQPVRDLRADLLSFTHRYWFTGVSNQLQGREIYDWWRERLGVQAIYDEVMTEAERAYEFQMAEEQQRQSEAASTLNAFLAATVPPVAAIGLLGMNLVSGLGNEQAADMGDPGQWAIVLGVLGVACLVSSGLLGWLRKTRDQPDRRPALHLLFVMILAASVLLAGSLWAYFREDGAAAGTVPVVPAAAPAEPVQSVPDALPPPAAPPTPEADQ